ELVTGELRIDDVFGTDSQSDKVTRKKRRHRIKIQYPRNSDAQLPACQNARGADLTSSCELPAWWSVRNFCHIRNSENLARRHVHEVGIFEFDAIQIRFNVPHLFDVFDR